ncbi:hypothetical protein [Pontibacter pamirensis]|uniref:hypothetical protein n=1 Tax=Pontibacter pamirensis TaxID=2562824 RepID=UPI001389ADD3|nr:hypothetical protein [Pontibacter pamirensis]
MGAARKPNIVERDRNIVAEYYIKGYSTRSIAKLIGETVGNGYTVTHNTVSKDIRALLKQWSADRINDIDQRKTIELEKLDKLERTYWEAWEKSARDHKKKSIKVSGKAKTPKEKLYREITEAEIVAYGNPSFLSGIQWCIDKRCKILGIDAPAQMDLTSKGQPIKRIASIKIFHANKEDAGSTGAGD